MAPSRFLPGLCSHPPYTPRTWKGAAVQAALPASLASEGREAVVSGKIIALHPSGFDLYVRDRHGRGWINLKLVATGTTPTRKRNWYMGWNGERLSRSGDSTALALRLPDIYSWVMDCLRGGCGRSPDLSATSRST
jgi:hypothetical protein